MERGGNAFQAIIDKQNSTEPRVGEEIERNGEGGEGEWDRVVETRGGFFLQGEKEEAGNLYT